MAGLWLHYAPQHRARIIEIYTYPLRFVYACKLDTSLVDFIKNFFIFRNRRRLQTVNCLIHQIVVMMASSFNTRLHVLFIFILNYRINKINGFMITYTYIKNELNILYAFWQAWYNTIFPLMVKHVCLQSISCTKLF